MANNLSLLDQMQECSSLVEEAMEKFLPSNFSDSKIVEAMRYSALGGGKKIRPFLLMCCAEIFQVSPKECLPIASAIEFAHVFSLIHDDLPAMDNDDYRRGKLANHKKFDEATAILAGDGLLALSFEILSVQNSYPPEMRCELIKILANALGYQGMIGGQMMDIEKTNQDMALEQILTLHHLKTGRLFVATAECGAVIGNASAEYRDVIKLYAKNLGLAFQIKDDILDYLNDNQDNQDPTSIVKLIGIDKSQALLKDLQLQAQDGLLIFSEKAQKLSALIEFVINRNK